MKIRITGNVIHDNTPLEKYEVYNLSEKDAKKLIEAGVAEAVPNYPDEKLATYTPRVVKKDKEGKSLPGQYEAVEPSTQSVKAVEPKQTDIKGGDDTENEQEPQQTSKGKAKTQKEK